MKQARNFAIFVVAVGIVAFAVGSMEASAQTSPGTPSVPVYQIFTPTSGTGTMVIVEQQLSTPRESPVTVYTVPTV